MTFSTMDDIRRYFDLNETDSLQKIDDETCRDLNLDDFFDVIDYTNSSIGQQYLYSMLRNIPNENKIESHEDWLKSYEKNEGLNNRLTKLLGRLNSADAYSIYPLICQEYQPLSKIIMLLYRILQFLPTVFLILFIITNSMWAILCLLAAFILNLIIHYRSKRVSFVYSGSIPQLSQLIYAAGKINKLPEMKDTGMDISTAIADTKSLKSKMSVFRYHVKLESDVSMLSWGISELIRVFFLVEPINLDKIFKAIGENKEPLKEIFEYVGFIDSLLSISKLRKEIPYYCQPQFTEENDLKVTDIYHPLIKECVPNSFDLKEKESYLILGSNMSGKTTFVRTVGINILTAQTLNTCFSKEMVLRKQKIFSAIAINDNLLEGHSYYLSEVLRIKHIIENTNQGASLILLDELFKGTNSIERISAAKAVLDHISENKNNKIMVATHDIELPELLKEKFRPIYFIESIEDNKLSFDYKIKHESTGYRNAIRILKLYDFPQNVISDALLCADNFEKQKNNQ